MKIYKKLKKNIWQNQYKKIINLMKYGLTQQILIDSDKKKLNKNKT